MQFYQTDTRYLKFVIDKIRYMERYKPYDLAKRQVFELNSAIIDDEMLNTGRPYYQIYPGVFEAVSNTTLDLDIDDWKVPFDIFEIRLPKTDIPLIPIQPNNSIGVMSIQIFRNSHKRLIMCSDNNTPFTYKYIKSNLPERLSLFDQHTNQTTIKVNICDFNNPQDDYIKQCSLATLRYEHGATMQKTVDSTIQRVTNTETFYSTEANLDEISACAWIKVLKLSLGVSLLATAGQKILEFDVLSRHLQAYREMREKNNMAGYRNIEKKAKEKGKNGWNIGKPRERHLPLSEGDSYDGCSGQGGHHHYSYYRCGHWHKYYVGNGRTKVKIKWLNPTVIRPDLPARECA